MADQEKKRRGSISELSSQHQARKSLDAVPIKGSNTHFVELLKAHVVNDLKTQKKIIELDASEHSAMSGFQVLLSNNLLSAPVWDSSANQYIGFLHVRDLVSSIMFSIKSSRTRARSISVAGASSPPPTAAAVINDEIQSEAKFNHSDEWMKNAEMSISKKINDPQHTITQELQLKYLARRNPFHPISGDMTLYEAARLLSGKIHRVPVLDAQGRVSKLVTQSSLVDFLAEHLGDLKEDANQTVEGTSLGLREVVSARGDRPALEAFMELDNHGLSGVAVVTRDGTIAGNTSAQDLRYFLLDRGALSLDMNLLDYLAAIRQQDVSADRAPVCSVGTSGTLGRIIGLLSATGYHRVYVVDARQCKPIGVVSLTDVLKYATAVNHLPLNPPETRQTRHSMSETRINSAAKLRVSVDLGRSRSPSALATPKSLEPPKSVTSPLTPLTPLKSESSAARVHSPPKLRPASPPKPAGPPPPKVAPVTPVTPKVTPAPPPK